MSHSDNKPNATSPQLTLSDLQKITSDSERFSLTTSQQEMGSEDALQLLKISTDKFEALISLQGAQLLTFKHAEGFDLLWTSPNAIYKAGKAIRGGIPICFPWFGPHPNDTTRPNHGFARTSIWRLESAEALANGNAKICFSFASNNDTLALFPYPFTAKIIFNLSDTIDVTFEVQNHGDKPMPCTWALHSYLPVSKLSEVRISGVDGSTYLDKTQNGKAIQQRGDVTFQGEVDRSYLNVAETQTLHTKPTLAISGSQCPTAIIWNPGAELAAKVSDLGQNMHEHYVCIERGAAFSDGWIVDANGVNSAHMQIKNIS